ncbi:MAG: TonB family protein [Crocinitomicaceae bacterium]|jgi:protein TonB|nr:TonB family protein [Crocinitomicaceae bacterium]
MEVILGIVFLIAGVSLYDYFTSKRWQQVTSVERNEIVFENRNRKYGAYVLRRDYDKSMVYIMAGVLVTFGIGFGSFIYARSLPDETISLPKNDITTTIETLDDKEEEIVEPPVKEEVVEPLTKTTAFVEPVVTDDDKLVTELPVDGEIDDKNIDTKNRDGEEIVWTLPDDKDPIDKVIEKDDDDKIIPWVDEEATFKGSINEYIVKKLVYPPIAIETGAQGKCYLKFVVNTDGTVSNVAVERGVPDCPECDAEAIRVIRSMSGWKPAKHNGKLVRSWMTIPINFTLE